MTDDLYDRLRAADPMPGSSTVEPADSPRTRALMEAAMSTDTTTEATHPTPSRQRSRLAPALIAAAAAGVILAGSLLVPDMLRDEPAPPTASLELVMPGEESILQSCAALSADVLRRMPIAFAGTATVVTDETVTMTVDTWYKGGTAASVKLTTPPEASVALLGYGIDFAVGDRYLISATDGVVNTCGFSGEVNPPLEAAFEDAYNG